MIPAVEQFLSALTDSIKDGSFVKLTLGNYKGADKHLQKINARLIETKKGPRFFVLYRQDTRDTARNFPLDEAAKIIASMLDGEFYSGHLFTTKNDFQLDIGKKGKARLNVSRPTTTAAPSLSHDRQKERRIDPAAFYLQALGITTEKGEIRDKQQDKWRQINKFVEVLESLVEKSELRDRNELRIIDMGSGKGYLTFAAYDYFQNVRGIEVTVTGVEARDDLVSICNDIADASGFDGLKFVRGTIDSFDVGTVDILIALHACDTATDDALYKGITANASLIIAVPCCHKEVRPQIKPPEMLRDILKHGVMLERTAETLTDGLRSLLLERSGYATKLFEFVATEHTPKNNMLVGTRQKKVADQIRFQSEIDAVKQAYGIKTQRLETLLTHNS